MQRLSGGSSKNGSHTMADYSHQLEAPVIASETKVKSESGGSGGYQVAMPHSNGPRSVSKRKHRLIIRPLSHFKDRALQQSIRNVIKKNLRKLLDEKNPEVVNNMIVDMVQKKLSKRKKSPHYAELQSQLSQFQQGLSQYYSLRKQLQAYYNKQQASKDDDADDSDDDSDDEESSSPNPTPSSSSGSASSFTPVPSQSSSSAVSSSHVLGSSSPSTSTLPLQPIVQRHSPYPAPFQQMAMGQSPMTQGLPMQMDNQAALYYVMTPNGLLPVIVQNPNVQMMGHQVAAQPMMMAAQLSGVMEQPQMGASNQQQHDSKAAVQAQLPVSMPIPSANGQQSQKSGWDFNDYHYFGATLGQIGEN